jgi:hypothetical protein
MNDTTKLVLAILVGIAFLFKIVSAVRDAMMRSRIPKMPPDELRTLFGKRKNFQFFHLATETLKSKGEDISCAFPAFLDLALSGTWVLELIGKGCLKTHFGDKLPPGIDLDEKRLSESTKEQLRGIKKQIDELTST